MGNFISNLKNIITSIVVKRSKLADSLEPSLEFKKLSDKYINTIEFGNNWDSYVEFDYDVFKALGIPDSIITYYRSSKENIPRELRSKVMELQKQKILTSYVEENEYYRMLHGEPPLTDGPKDWIYCPPNDRNIPTNIPVHKLAPEQINYLYASGIMTKLIIANPTKAYLNYLNYKSISYYNARTANNYEIIYVDSLNCDTNILKDFRIAYDKARTYYMLGVYNKNYSNMFEWYDEFIGLCILIMAIQRTIANIYKQGLTRDFYDVELIKYLFKSYSIPYIDTLELKYQKSIAKKLNYLLQYKSTDKVLFDISYILGFYNINIYRYYLVKRHKLDMNDNPIFIYKTFTDSDGKEVKIPDYKKMYDFYFQRINIKNPDVNTALTNVANNESYEAVTVQDPYWVNDTDLYNKLYESEFNTLITKYMSLDVAYKIVDMMYEVSHTIRMIIDDQDDFKYLMITIPQLSSDQISLYDTVIFLCATAAHKMGLKGIIPVAPSKAVNAEGITTRKIASVYGFNYKADLDKLREEIYNNEEAFSKVDPTLVQYIYNMKPSSLPEFDRIFTNLVAFRKLITLAIFLTKDRDTYYQYIKLYKALLISNDVNELYKDHNGNIQLTFESLLAASNPSLYNTFCSIKDGYGDPDEYIDAIYIRFSQLSDSFKYISSYNNKEIMFEHLLKFIRFFKSYTVDFVNCGITYFLDDRYLMGLKIIDECDISSIGLELDDQLDKYFPFYKDFIDTTAVNWQEKLKVKLIEDIIFKSYMRYQDYIKTGEDLKVSVGLDHEENAKTLDFIEILSSSLRVQSSAKLSDEAYWNIFVHIDTNEYLKFVEKYNIDFSMYLNHDMSVLDFIESAKSTLYNENSISFSDALFHRIVSNVEAVWNINMKNDVRFVETDSYNDEINPIIDSTEQISSQPIDNKLKIKDRVFYTVTE